MCSKARKDNNKKDSKVDPKLDTGNPKIKEIDKIYERKVAENRALDKLLKEINKKNKEN